MNHPMKRDVELRLRLQAVVRRGWVAGRRWVTPRLVRWVDRVEARLGIIPERAWFDPVDRAVDDTFPASDPPSHSSPHAGPPTSHAHPHAGAKKPPN